MRVSQERQRRSCVFASALLLLFAVGAAATECDIDIFCNGIIGAKAVYGVYPDCICICNNNFDGPYCAVCKFGWTGPLCEYCLAGWVRVGEDCVDTCTNATSSCSGHGAANWVNGSCTCDCGDRYSGSHCNSCDEGYTAYPQCHDACSSTNVSCHGHADSVGGAYPNCSCECSFGYAGDLCDRCASGFLDQYPACTDLCINPSTSCNRHAVQVTVRSNSTAPDCVCTCADGYGGLRCESCAVGYAGYPDCHDNCSDPFVSCGAGGRGVWWNYSTVPASCSCRCSPVYVGNRCEACIPQRTGFPMCSACASGYTGLPFCTDACTNVEVSCGGHATGVAIVGGVCLCNCTREYAGTRCSSCNSGYRKASDGVTCIDACTLTSVSCNSHADGVLLNPFEGTCICWCTVNKTGGYGYAGGKCEVCAVGYSNYPLCIDNCTMPEVSCSRFEGSGTAVAGSHPSCVCTCAKRYTGSLCDRCAYGFMGYGFPACIDECLSVTLSCNSHAFAVIALASGGCFCNCSVGYGGDSCERCALGFEGNECEKCAPGFSYMDYPYCLDDCTNVTASCSGHGRDVYGTGGNCSCRCIAGWAGPRCTYCDAGYYGDNCNYCSFGYDRVNDSCIDSCTLTSVSCNNLANSVSGSNGNCTCECYFQRGGSKCEHCATGYTGTADYCNLCAHGYEYSPMPYCVDACVLVAVSCGGESFADSVTKIGGVCVCKCKAQYSGNRCEKCADGYADYPTCHDNCTLTNVSCAHEATSVHGVFSNCRCECVGQYGGRLCADCKYGFEGPTCTDCAAGFFYPPLCLDNCTDLVTSCAGHATNVSGVNGSCLCNCTIEFSGSRCTECSEGYDGYPSCVLACTPSRCHYHASAVSGTYPNCTCTCLFNYGGDHCEHCGTNFAGADCGECAPGFTDYPECHDGCTNTTVSCHGHASSVYNTYPYCQCVCLAGFGGATCGGCDSGYELYPLCTDACTVVSVSCNASHAVAVTGTPPNCVCECATGYGGARCDRCKYGFAGYHCDQCAVGFTEYGSVYPNCTDNCTSDVISCNGRVNSPVTGSHGKCVCDCISRYAGERCDRCASHFTGSLCMECVAGFEGGGWPICSETCTNPSASCNGNAISVSGSAPDCKCTCKYGFKGDRCEGCAEGYTGSLCRYCAPGYTRDGSTSLCIESCTNTTVSCSSLAYDVTGTPGNCVCECWTNWISPGCRTCYRSFTGPDCSLCADGFVDPPRCTENCSNASVSCNGVGLTVNGTNGVCRCTCPAQYTGNRCESCATGYTSYPTCSEDCSSPSVSCMGRANASWGTAPHCNCSCLHPFTGPRCSLCVTGYTGPACDACASGYRGYPNCTDACTVLEVSCGSHGLRVTVGAGPGLCLCVCQDYFDGPPMRPMQGWLHWFSLVP